MQFLLDFGYDDTHMPKIITSRRQEGEADKAREYIRAHILFPSGILGLIFIISGTASLGYQFFVETYSWHTFLESTALLVIGGTLGWGLTRYQKFILLDYPEYFANRMKTFARTKRRRSKREAPSVSHRGRGLVPLGYLLGILLLLAASALSALFGHVYYTAAFLLPWAGFFWAKLFFWRGVMRPSAGGRG